MARSFTTADEYEAFVRKNDVGFYSFGDWSLDSIRMIVRDGDTMMRISHQQCEVLCALLEALPSPVPTADLARAAFMNPETVKTIIRRLRVRIGSNRIVTNRGGYEFVPFPEAK